MGLDSENCHFWLVSRSSLKTRPELGQGPLKFEKALARVRGVGDFQLMISGRGGGCLKSSYDLIRKYISKTSTAMKITLF